MVDACLDDVSEQRLLDVVQKLAAIEAGAFRYVHSLTDHDPDMRYEFGRPPDRNALRNFGEWAPPRGWVQQRGCSFDRAATL